MCVCGGRPWGLGRGRWFLQQMESLSSLQNVRDCDKDEVSGPLGGQALGSQEWRPVTTRSFGVWSWLCAPPRDS